MNPESDLRPPLDGDRLRAALGDLSGLVVEIVDETASTNALVAERARSRGEDAGRLVIVAEHQLAGRGRLDRAWESPARTGLTFSMLLPLATPPGSWTWLPLIAGYAVNRVLRAEGYDTGLKWPNDVLVADRKVAGILVELVETPQGPAAVLGIGLNTDLTEGELPVPNATALSLESPSPGKPPDRTDLLAQILLRLSEVFDDWQAGSGGAESRLAEEYAGACLTLGRHVTVHLPDDSRIQGRATSIDASGRLVLDVGPPDAPLRDRVEHRVGAGDVTHVRSIGK